MLPQQSIAQSNEVYYGITCDGRLLSCCTVPASKAGKPNVIHAFLGEGTPLKFNYHHDARQTITNGKHEYVEYFTSDDRPQGLYNVIIDIGDIKKVADFRGQELRIVKVVVTNNIYEAVQ